MANLFPEELVSELAVIGPRHEIAAQVVARVEGITDSVSLVSSRAPDAAHFADIVAGIRALTSR